MAFSTAILLVSAYSKTNVSDEPGLQTQTPSRSGSRKPATNTATAGILPFHEGKHIQG